MNEQELVESVAKAMYEAPDPSEPDYMPSAWPPAHPDDRAYMLNMAKCAIDAVREFDEREEHVETVWEFFESLPVGTFFGINYAMYEKTEFETVLILHAQEKVSYRKLWLREEENVYVALGGVVKGR